MSSLISLTLRTKFMNGAILQAIFAADITRHYQQQMSSTSKSSAVWQVPSSAVSYCINRDITLFHVAREDFPLRVSPHFFY